MSSAFRLAVLALFFQLATVADAGLAIQVLRGGGGNNNAVPGNAASPVVRVVNQQGVPIQGALVIFKAPMRGPSIEFAGTGATAQAITDETGAASASRIRPVGANGQVEIQVVATKEGRTANALIVQMNLGLDSLSESPDLIMEISMIPGASVTASRQVVFRVQNGSGHPVPGARVVITIHAMRHGRMEEIGHMDQISGPDG